MKWLRTSQTNEILHKEACEYQCVNERKKVKVPRAQLDDEVLRDKF